MPHVAHALCVGGCGRIVARGYCDSCRRHAAGRERRGSSTQRGYGYKWQCYSRDRLRRFPLCVDPDKRHPGLVVLAEHTDHIEAVHGPEDPRFWDSANHQSLCQPCHSAKTVRDDGGFGRSRR